MPKLSEDVRGYLRFFAYFLVNGSLQVSGLLPVDYRSVLDEPSMVEQTFAIWSNVLEVDSEGRVLNEHVAHQRAAQYIRQQADRAYIVEPPFEEWEIALHM
jgi:hypothetical protein